MGADAVVAGDSTTCVLRGEDAWCFGYNGDGRLGLGDMPSTSTPVQLPGSWRQLSLSQHHGCGIRTNGSLWCWGGNEDGELGDGTIERRREPALVGTNREWERVVTAVAHTCALRSDGSLWCWGRNDDGELGTGTAWTSSLTLIR
jgi:alpha-tubulin suppressor-like RCC1 family protein